MPLTCVGKKFENAFDAACVALTSALRCALRGAIVKPE